MADDQEGRSTGSVAPPDGWVSRQDVNAADLVARDTLRGALGLALGAAGLALAAMRELLEVSSRPAGTAALVASERTAALPRPGEGLWRWSERPPDWAWRLSDGVSAPQRPSAARSRPWRRRCWRRPARADRWRRPAAA